MNFHVEQMISLCESRKLWKIEENDEAEKSKPTKTTTTTPNPHHFITTHIRNNKTQA
jgi:hypothetical protein